MTPEPTADHACIELSLATGINGLCSACQDALDLGMVGAPTFDGAAE